MGKSPDNIDPKKKQKVNNVEIDELVKMLKRSVYSVV